MDEKDELEVFAQEAYGAYWLKLEGMVPAGLATSPHRLQTWEQLPGPVRDAWLAALRVLIPATEEPTSPLTPAA